MKSLRCLTGHHEWQAGKDPDGQPYEVCLTCEHYRYPDSGQRRPNDVHLSGLEAVNPPDTSAGY